MESYNPQRLISNNIWSLDQQDTPTMRSLSAWKMPIYGSYSKCLKLIFYSLKMKKKIYVLQKGNIMIIDFFSRYRIIIFTDLIWYKIELFRFPTESENSLPARFIHKLWFFSLILDIIMKLTRFLCQSIEFMPWAI